MYIKSSKNRRGRRVYAAEEEAQNQAPAQEETGNVSVDPEATELVFETEDVAELIAEVTGQDVEVVADENEITFTVGDTDYTVESEGQEEVLEATSLKGRRPVRASRGAANTNRSAASNNRRPVSASSRRPSNGRTIRRISR